MTRVTLTVALLLMPTVALANGGREWTEIDADAAVDRCWAVGQDKRDSGTTPIMREGTEEAIACLEAEILRQTSEFLVVEDAARVPDQLVAIQSSIRGLYSAVYNRNKGCAPWCGTINQLFPGAEVAAVFEALLRDVIRERNEQWQ